MGSLYRSEEMVLAQIFLQTDSAYESISEMGELGIAQFRDLNPDMNPYQRKFVNEVRRCDEMDRKLRYIENEVKKEGIPIPDMDDHIVAPLPKDMVELEAKLERLEEELCKINTSLDSLKANYTELCEMRVVLERVQQFLDEGQRTQAHSFIMEGSAGPLVAGPDLLRPAEKSTEAELKFMAGVIKRDRCLAFETMVWRMCRGNVFVRTADIGELNDPLLVESTNKAVFILFYYGDQLQLRGKKICDAFRASVYNCPESQTDRAVMEGGLKLRVAEMKTVVNQTIAHRDNVLRATSNNIKTWMIKVMKIKSIFHTLNLFNLDVTQKCLIAECWIPKCDLHLAQECLQRGREMSGANVTSILNALETSETPPTYNKLNKFTHGFQNIVDSYGIGSYREVNPAPFTIITFPFIFAVMFGDCGHGVIMFLSALMFVLFERKLTSMKIRDEIFNTFFDGRYIILLMGIFSIYTGIVYNDIYSRSIDIFGSSWRNPYNLSVLEDPDAPDTLTFPPENAFLHKRGPYPFGLDPVWNIADNRLNFMNPMKMKMSVIIGIAQMTFGLCLSLSNYLHFRSALDVIVIFIPQFLFLLCIFIYLCAEIVVKWIFFYTRPKFIFGKYYPSSNCAPSLLIGLINMFMLKSRKEGFADPVTHAELDQCHLQQWYPNQSLVEEILLIIAVVSIPVMLLVKPIYLKIQHSRGVEVHTGHGDEGEEFNFGDVMVYQAIHTIEYCLGCISHTASYLRLWALSLAHAQLSEVLWGMVFHIAFQLGGWAGVAGQFIIFWIFAVLSISILVLMEGLSAFLHALRLHWVEFQSKFYQGLGYAFEPFSFDAILERAAAEAAM